MILIEVNQMKLDLQRIKSITQGAERITEEKGAVWFSRFTEAEMALYLARPGFDYRARGTAGIQMEFTTDATSLFMQVTTPEGPCYHSFFAYDILVDGIPVGQLRNFTGNPENGHYAKAVFPTDHPRGSFALGTGTKKVRIVFPWSMSLGLETLELTGATFIEPVKKSRRLLIYGDSITQGSCSLYPSQTYATLLADWMDAHAISKAVGSEAYFPALAEAATAPEPDCITVSYGANDWVTCTEAEFTENCRKFWAAICAKYPNAKKFALTPIWYMDWQSVKSFCPFEDLARIIRDVTGEFPDVTVIDCTDFVSRDNAHFGDLWIHPNHTGFGLFFGNLKQALAPYL